MRSMAWIFSFDVCSTRFMRANFCNINKVSWMLSIIQVVPSLWRPFRTGLTTTRQASSGFLASTSRKPSWPESNRTTHGSTRSPSICSGSNTTSWRIRSTRRPPTMVRSLTELHLQINIESNLGVYRIDNKINTCNILFRTQLFEQSDWLELKLTHFQTCNNFWLARLDPFPILLITSETEIIEGKIYFTEI